MKKQFWTSLVLTVVLIPQISFAAWWNPTTWFKKPVVSTLPKVVQVASTTPTASQIKEKPTAKIATSTPVPKPVSQKPKVVAPTKLTNAEIIKKVKPAVVYVDTKDGSGSGMIISSDGFVLTNAHVVKGSQNVDISVSSGGTFSATVIGRDEEADVAILKMVSDLKFPVVDFADSDKVEQGDEIFTLGYPFGIKGDVSFKEGTISRRIEKYFETSAEIHPGNSGGPLVNRYGQVIGINSGSYGRSVQGVQIGETIKLAIPVNIAKKLFPELQAGKNNVVNQEGNNKPTQDPVSTGTSVTVSDPGQPLATIAPKNATRLPFIKVKLTASTDGDIVIRSFIVQKIGTVDDAVFSGITLIDENGIQIGENKTLNLNHQVILGDIITIPRGQSKIFTVVGNRAPENNTLWDGQIVTFAIIGINTSARVLGSLPIQGVKHTINNSLILGSATISPSTKFGGVKFNINSKEDLTLWLIKWDWSRTTLFNNLTDVRVFIDGVAYHPTISEKGGNYSAVFNSGILLEKDSSKEIYVLAEIIDNDKNKTIQLNLYKDAEWYFSGNVYNFGIQIIKTPEPLSQQQTPSPETTSKVTKKYTEEQLNSYLSYKSRINKIISDSNAALELLTKATTNSLFDKYNLSIEQSQDAYMMLETAYNDALGLRSFEQYQAGDLPYITNVRDLDEYLISFILKEKEAALTRKLYFQAKLNNTSTVYNLAIEYSRLISNVNALIDGLNTQRKRLFDAYTEYFGL